MFQALLSGVMIVLPCTMGSLDDPVSLLAAVLRFQVTLFTTTPSLLQLVLDVVQDCSKSIRLLTCLRLVSLMQCLVHSTECVKRDFHALF